MFRRFGLLALMIVIAVAAPTKSARAQLCVPDLTADANGDCVVDPLDSGFVLARLGCAVGTGDLGCDFANVNGDGLVDPLDIGYVLARFCGGGILPVVAFDPPVPLTKALTVNLAGTSIRAAQVEVAGGTQLVTVAVDQCTWEADVGLAQDQVNFLYVTGIAEDGVRGTPVPVTVTNDTKHPDLFIDFPLDGADLTTETTDVAGRVSDTLSGFVGLSVNVNRLPAEVNVGIGTNGTFFLGGLPLELGDNLITATAADVLGNMITKSVTVTRVEVPEDAPVMTVLFGNGQSGTVHSYLPLPIVVQVTGGNGKPIASKLVTFDVTRSDGRLADQPSGEGSIMFQAFTDAKGKATAFWLLGGTAGAGSDRVCATSNGIIGSAFLCASATPGPPHHINVGSGNNLRAETGGLAPEPLRIWVNDQCNGVANLPITFKVAEGGGLVNGQSSAIVSTDNTGHAEVDFILGPDPGNNRIEATFAGNPFSPAVFLIYGLERRNAFTTFSGVIFDNASRPLGGAGVRLLVTGQEAGLAVTDVDGRFEINAIAFSGEADVYIDGDPINTVNGQPVPADIRFPDLHYNTQIIDGAANSLPTPILLPLLDTVNDRVYFGDQTTDLELTCEGIEGLKMIVKAGTTITLPDGTQVGPNLPGSSVTLGLNQVQHEDVPMPMTDGAAPPFAWTLQPAGSKFDPPVEIEYPNMTGLPAGAISNFLSFNHTTGKFEIVATGTVDADGLLVRSDPGDGIDLSGWGCNCPPYSVTANCCHCNENCQFCLEGTCVTLCPGGQSCCGTFCCDGVCCDGLCFAAGAKCCEGGSVCVLEETSCCGSNCCDQEEACCGSICCASLDQCCENDVCCGEETPVCCEGACFEEGTVCCPEGGTCTSPNSVCCPNGCALDGSTCCGESACPPPNSVCCDDFCAPSGSHCCGESFCPLPNNTCCNDSCYLQGSECCGDSACEPPNSVCCGDVCCADDEECCNGQCIANAICCPDGHQCEYPGFKCCGSSCCGDDQPCCNGTFCGLPGSECCLSEGQCSPPETICCGTGCCNIGQVCCNGMCNPAGSQCCLGGVCEPPNSVCCPGGCAADDKICCGSSTCPADQVCCNDACYAGGSECCGDSACEPPNSVCCGAGCCPTGTVCCNGQCVAEDPGCP